MARDSHPTLNVSKFRGLDNINAVHEVGLTGLVQASNVDITRSNKPRRRSGSVLITADSYVAIAVEDDITLALDSSGNVKQLDSAFAVVATYTALVGFGPHNKLRINRILDNVIFSNGIASGLCDHTSAQELAFDATHSGERQDRGFDYSVPPAFNDVETFGGRNYYASGERLYFSPVFGYYKIRRGKDYYRFPDTVTMVAKVETGLFVGTLQKTYFLSNKDPHKAILIEVSPVGVIEGTKTYAQGSIIGEGEDEKTLPVWATTTGFCVGLTNGSVNNVTQKYVTLPQGSIGSAMFRHENGQNHIVSVIQT